MTSSAVVEPMMRADLDRYLRSEFQGARVEPLAGDASTRRFLRIHHPDGRSSVVMDYGRPYEGETDDIVLGRVFREAGLPVAELRAAVPEVGCLVVEDLGDRTLQRALEENPDPDLRHRLYHAAVDLLLVLADRGTEALRRSPRKSGPALDVDRFRFEMDFFVQHFVRGWLGRESVPGTLVSALADLAARAADGSVRVFCHRDFHSRNLMVRDDGSLAMVDIQDARWGPDSYDLASLLRDAYVDLTESEVADWLDYFAGRRFGERNAAFEERFHLVAAQRMIKALGTFGFQLTRRGNPLYGGAIPRTLERLERMLPAHPVTEPLDGALRRAGAL